MPHLFYGASLTLPSRLLFGSSHCSRFGVQASAPPAPSQAFSAAATAPASPQPYLETLRYIPHPRICRWSSAGLSSPPSDAKPNISALAFDGSEVVQRVQVHPPLVLLHHTALPP